MNCYSVTFSDPYSALRVKIDGIQAKDPERAAHIAQGLIHPDHKYLTVDTVSNLPDTAVVRRTDDD